MKFYIVDDDVTIIKILENIIDDKNLGQVVGSSIDPLECIEDIILKNPDIVIVDLLMPKSDGIEVVNNIKKEKMILR
ncbi:response regulator receiver protein [Alkalithermobacter thermoalcaliphilus JW-YL-7 = DSM 7308]|uniref:Stage 0 sporulation protein A homolog n=1 Tax=Alkalithermobacter thermoalcaliphilus JW-YL-7 = DSM 7308 TaxID=1121328 RepID=A0A150FT18_CLOPD|nr:response regulator receiver protein [[Clostridium] paradoxum JW-YL-7 = DSM 7308]